MSLLFCGITLKHYAYFNMSRRTQLATKYIFNVMAQLVENFIFIYLGLALFADSENDFKPPLIIITFLAVIAARWVAVFPLSKVINWFIRYRAQRRGTDPTSDELPYNYQAMLFWAGLRGAVGVALAALLAGENSSALRATVLVVVVLTVIIFGGTTARMLEILGIRTGVVDEIDSDDEFDTETLSSGLQSKRTGTGIGYMPRRNGNLPLHNIPSSSSSSNQPSAAYVSGHISPNTESRARSLSRKNSHPNNDFERADLLGRHDDSDLGSDIDTSDLPPPARRSPNPPTTPPTSGGAFINNPTAADPLSPSTPMSARGAIRQLLSADDPADLFRQLDEDYIKPRLLLGDNARNHGSGSGGSNV